MLRRLAEVIMRKPDRKGRIFVLGILLRFLDGSPIRSRYGPLLVLRAHDLTNQFSIIGTNRIDYDDVFAEVSLLEPGMFFIDIGANAGLFSMIAGERVGPTGAVVAFEPSPHVFRDLVDNAALNNLTAFYPFNLAVGDSMTMARFNPGRDSHSGVAHLDPAGGMSVPQICADPLDKIVTCIIGDRRGIVKIDVEGAEEVVIDSMRTLLRRPQLEKAVVEIDQNHLSRFGGSVAAVYQKMTGLGFTARRGVGAGQHYNEVFVRGSDSPDSPETASG